MFIPKGNGKYTSKAIPLTEAEYNSVTINNVFNKEQYAEQAVNNAEQAAQAISLNELISQALQAQSTPETAENGVAETSSSTEDVVTNNVVENQVSYPTKKDGGIDYDNLTPEQEYFLTAQEYGEDVAQEDVKSYIEQYQSAIDNIQSQLDSKNGTNSRAKMREAMRKNQDKLEAWKALLKEEVAEQQEVSPVEETNALPNDVKTEDGNPVVKENAMPKDVNAEDVNKQTIEGSEKASEGENAPGNGGVYADNQGNPVDADGKLIVDEVNSIDEITDEDFETPTRNVQLPAIPENVANAIGANGRPVVIKKNVFEKNGNTHVELEPEDSRNILRSALYNPNLVGSTQPIRRPDYKVAIRTGEKNAVVVLDVYQEKDFVEIVGWRMVNEKGLAKMQRQAEMEGGQFLILSPNDGSAAALSALPLGLSSASEDTNIVPEKQEKVLESDENNNQTPEEVVQQALIETAEKRKEDALVSFSESGAYTEALGAATEDTTRKAEAFFKVIEEYGVRLTTKAPSINGNYIQFVQGRIGKLSEEQQAEVMEAVVAYKRAYMDQLVIEKFNSELANITDSKVHEEQTNSANEAIRNVKAANDNMLNDMVAKGDFSNEHMLITSHKDTEKSDNNTLDKNLLLNRNNAMNDYQKRYDEVVNLNKTEERAKKRAEKRADVRSGDIKRKKVWIKNREGEIVDGWVKGDETFESSGAYTIFRNETGKERYTPRKRKDIFKDENGSDSYAPVVKQGESEIEKRTIRIKRDVKTSDVSKNIVDLIGKIKTGDVGSVSELKDIIKSLKSKIVTLCKKINESDFSDEVKVYLLDELDSAYFFAEQQETDGVQKSPAPTKGKVADAILKIRTTPQQRGGNRTYVDKKGNVKERKNETFETIEDLLGANNEVVEIISDKLNNVHEIIEESESSLRVETPLYSEGTMSNSNPISLNEALKGIATLVRGFNLQDRIVVAMNLEQLKKINEKAYEAELNGEEVRGFYLPSKHQIVLYVPNLLSKGSVENVIFHEGVAHFGLRELLGEEEFNNFCKQVWKAMPYADKKAMMEYIGKEYVYNQKVSEGDMIAAAEEYVAHLAETPMFAEYLRNRNEQEAVSWIAKKWKKVCNLIRKIFKKRTGEELLSSDENIMDALYRSYQLLGSDDYAMFDYYRSLTEQMRKEDVKVGEIDEEEFEEAYVNKSTIGERSDEEKEDISFSRRFIGGINAYELIDKIDLLSSWSNGFLNLTTALEDYFKGEIVSASNGAKHAIERGLVPVPAHKYAGLNEEYHHIEFRGEDGETFVEAVPFVKAEDVEKDFDIRFSKGDRLTKRTVEKGYGGIWVADKQEYAKFVSAVNNYSFEEDGEGIAYTDNFLYAYYWNNEGDPIPFASVYLNSENSQNIVKEVINEIKNGRGNKGIKQYFDRAIARARSSYSENNANNGNNNSTSPSTNNDRLDSNISRKGRYYDSPNLYVKTQRADWFGQPINEGTILFSKGKPAGYVNLSSEMFKGKRNVLSVLEAKDAAILNASKKWFESVLGEGNLVTDNYVSRDVYMPKR